MIVGIGTDIEHTHRFQDKGKHQLSKWFTDEEIKYCESKHFPHRHYAARWAAKESFIKAAGLKMAIGLKNIEVFRQSNNGKPGILLHGELSKYNGYQIHVSLSHAGGCATAVVLLAN